MRKRAAIWISAMALLSACATPVASVTQPMPAFPPELEAQLNNQPGSCTGRPTSPTQADFFRVYPPGALNKGLQGWVFVRVHVETDGHISAIDAIQSAPAGTFDDAGQKLVATMVFPPQDAPCTKFLRVRFSLDW